MAQMVENLPAMLETQVLSLGWEDPLEKGMATHSSIFAQRIPWTEEPGGLQSMGRKKLDTTERLILNTRKKCVLSYDILQMCRSVTYPCIFVIYF